MANLDYRVVLDSLQAGMLVFDAKDHLLLANTAAETILGPNLILVRSDGWSAFAMLYDASSLAKTNQTTAGQLRARAQRQGTPVRFQMLLGGQYAPCSLSVVREDDHSKEANTVVMIEQPDWSALTELMSTFRAEARTAIVSTSGHAEFIKRLLTTPPLRVSEEELRKRAVQMIGVIATDMYHLQLLMDMLHRLEIIRIGAWQRSSRTRAASCTRSILWKTLLKAWASARSSAPAKRSAPTATA
ncbi:MAG: PAS domain-containing protein [Anaerolineae bacterium]|nr:PAS domain-containing protein [Anaerolineae bacterium]